MKDLITINVPIKKEQEKQFIKVPFDVPDNVEVLNISYKHQGDNVNSVPTANEKNVIDILILDEKGKEVGATGSNKKNITISESYSTPGYSQVEINKGKWNVVFGAYLVAAQGVEVTLTVKFTYKRFRWLKGDTHLHTVNSDGHYDVFGLAKKALKQKLDFIIITDHNNFFYNKRLPSIKNLTIIPGVEYTHYNGHLNLWGVNEPYTGTYAINSFDEFKDLLKEATDNGAISSLNHPHCTLCPWRWPLDGFTVDAVEVWNGPMRKDNLTTVEWWHEKLKEGKKMVAIGGSDYHKNYAILDFFAKPTTWVWAKSNSKKDILDGIKNGRVIIAKSPKEPYIELTSDEKVAGESVKLTDNTKIKIKVSLLKRKHTLLVYDKEGIIYKHNSKKSAPHEIELNVVKKGFIRAEIKYQPKFIESSLYRIAMYFMIRSQAKDKVPPFISALSNPIYFD